MVFSKSCKHDESELDSAEASTKKVSVYCSLLCGVEGKKRRKIYNFNNTAPKNLSHKSNIDTTLLKEVKSRT